MLDELTNSLEDKEDDNGLWAGISEGDIGYYIDVDWYEDNTASYYFSIWELD